MTLVPFRYVGFRGGLITPFFSPSVGGGVADFSAGVSADESFSGKAGAAAALSAGISAGDQQSALTAAIAALNAGLEAGETEAVEAVAIINEIISLHRSLNVRLGMARTIITGKHAIH